MLTKARATSSCRIAAKVIMSGSPQLRVGWSVLRTMMVSGADSAQMRR
jgi:hypothetical protein